MAKIMSSRLSRVFAIALSACAIFALPEPVSASTLQYNLTLSPDPNYGGPLPPPWPPEGSGFFTFDEALIPSTGNGSVAASDLEFNVGGHSFGYSIGSYVLNVYTNDWWEIVHLPHRDAFISFQNYAPVGISYEESHTCGLQGYGCYLWEIATLSGTKYSLYNVPDWVYPGPNAIQGLITITGPVGPVPEPATYLQVLAGLLLVSGVSRLRPFGVRQSQQGWPDCAGEHPPRSPVNER